VGATVKGVFGNLKFDATPNAQQLAQGLRWREQVGRPVVMFASSREGEEAQFFRAIQAQRGAGARWLVVPRHPQRFDEVASLAQVHELTVSRRSAWTDAPQDADVWIGDSLGEMAMYYGLADVALLGGSFEKLGGQNLIEAAACGCPVVMGPHTFNFEQAAQLAQEAGAALRVQDMAGAVVAAVTLTSDLARHESAVRSARAFSSTHQGAALKTADAVLALVARRAA
jgi:3-deoxy-D-manno-octulosonic-acid transferase